MSAGKSAHVTLMPHAQDPVASARRCFWIIALLSAVLMLAPIRSGDLAGYDDARFAMVAKHMVLSGQWLEVESNGRPALEHPPFFSWMQAAFFVPFGLSDPLAKLPAALCGIGVLLLTAWLARKLTGDAFTGALAMFVMATTVYFIKYAARAMTDVPFTFFVLAAVCAWVLSEEDPRWLLAAGAFTAMAQLTRALAGIAIPLIFVTDMVMNRRRPPVRWLLAAALVAFIPPLAWYGQWIARFGPYFFKMHAEYMDQEVTGQLSPPWRHYTGLIEYLWMVAKSYWPWFPPMLAGLIVVVRRKDAHLRVLIPWIAVIYVLCGITKSRVLRYMLPAYPAFAILAAIGLLCWIPERYIKNGLRVALPILAVLVAVVAIRPPITWHAPDTRPMALIATRATAPTERITFYDDGVSRDDEKNELLWYGDRYLITVFDPAELPDALAHPRTRVFVMDAKTYDTRVASHLANEVIARQGHLICFRLLG